MKTQTKRNLIGLAIIVVIVAVVAVSLLIVKGDPLRQEMQLYTLEGGWQGHLDSIPVPAEGENAAPLYEQASETLKALPEDASFAIAAWEDRDKFDVDLGAAVWEARFAIRAARNALARPAFYFDAEGLSTSDFVDAWFEATRPSQSAVRLICVDAVVAFEAGQQGRAVRRLLEAFAAHDHLGTYQLAMTPSIQSRVDITLLKVLLAHGQKAGEELRELDDVLATRDWQAAVHEAMLMERQFMIASYEEDPDWQTREEWLQAFQDNRAAIEMSTVPYHESPVQPSTEGQLEYLERITIEGPSMQDLVEWAATSQVWTNMARSAIALRLHRLEHGGYPADYEALPDVLTGEPLEYERTATGFVLRCSIIGPEGKPLEWRWE